MIPIYPADQQYFDAFPKHIIIHHTAELNPIPTGSRLDNRKFQVNKIKNHLFKFNGTKNLPYHYLIERIDDDYEIIGLSPISSKIEIFADIPDAYSNSIHIALLGDYNEDIPEFRLYQRLAYNLIAPIMTLFRIPIDNIFLHSEISKSYFECPGEFFSKIKLLSYIRLYQKRKFINRK